MIGRLLPVVERFQLANIALDPVEAGCFHHRPDIVQYQAGKSCRRSRRHHHRHKSAQRCTDQTRVLEPQVFDQRKHVLDVGGRRVIFRVGIMVRSSATALVGDDQFIIAGQMPGQRFKIGAVPGEAVHQQQRRTFRIIDAGIEVQPAVSAAIDMVGICHHICLGAVQNFTPAVTKTWRGFP